MTTSTNSTNEKELSLKEIVGGGYREFWRSKKRYRVVKGSRASKKSTTTALNIIFRMVEYPEANTLVIRQTMSTLKETLIKADLLFSDLFPSYCVAPPRRRTTTTRRRSLSDEKISRKYLNLI